MVVVEAVRAIHDEPGAGEQKLTHDFAAAPIARPMRP